jgi:hypothetical protein
MNSKDSKKDFLETVEVIIKKYKDFLKRVGNL